MLEKFEAMHGESGLRAHSMYLITYDYRGICESRPATLRGFNAGWIDWGDRSRKRRVPLARAQAARLRAVETVSD
jgi:predicted alpha/beta hydrolase